MRHASELLVRLLPGVWLGLLIGISFIETPLKFRAPEITLERGLGIGRIVFHALNRVELVIAVVLLIALFGGRPGVGNVTRWALVVTVVALLVQVFVLRPVLDRRLDERVAGHAPASSMHHVAYIGLEVLKVGALATVSISIAARSRMLG